VIAAEQIGNPASCTGFRLAVRSSTLSTSAWLMLWRNLLYTAVTRAWSR
jgi:hypothetical protein